MDKKLIIIPISLLLLAFLFTVVHELGHYTIAKQAGYEASMHFFKTTEATKNNILFSRGIAYTQYVPKPSENKDVDSEKVKKQMAEYFRKKHNL